MESPSTGSDHEVKVLQHNSDDAEDVWIDVDTDTEKRSGSCKPRSKHRLPGGPTYVRNVHSTKLTGSLRSKSVCRFPSATPSPRMQASTSLPSNSSKLGYGSSDPQALFLGVPRVPSADLHDLPANTSKVARTSRVRPFDIIPNLHADACRDICRHHSRTRTTSIPLAYRSRRFQKCLKLARPRSQRCRRLPGHPLCPSVSPSVRFGMYPWTAWKKDTKFLWCMMCHSLTRFRRIPRPSVILVMQSRL